MIDIHSHFFPAIDEQQARDINPSLPWLRIDDDGAGMIMRGRDEFRPVQPPLWDGSERVRALDRFNIDCQIVCATPILFDYQGEPQRVAHASAALNDCAIAHCAVDSNRLKSLCQVPLQDLKLACDELDRAMAAGHIGVQIGNHVGERDFDDGELVEFLQHCAQIGAPVLVHPWDMFARERMDRYMLQWLVAMPAETQLSILYLILSGAFERLPESLKICFAHGGGSFAYLLGRVDNAWHQRDIVRVDCPQPPSSYCGRFYTDSAVFNPDSLTLLADVMSDDRVLFGTDFPFPLGEAEPGKLVKTHEQLSAAGKQKILVDNARHFFGAHHFVGALA